MRAEPISPLVPAIVSPGRLTTRVIGGNASLRGRLIGLVWIAVLVGPLSSAVELPGMRAVIASTMIVAFATIYAALFITIAPDSQRRDALIVLVLAALAFPLPAAFGSSYWLPLLFVASAAVMVLPWRVGLGALVGVNVYAIGCGLLLGWTSDELGDVVVSCALASTIVLTVSRLIRTIGALKVAEGQLAAAAVNEERLRFSRDLHDLLGHSLSTIVVKTELARRLVDVNPGRAVQETYDIERLAREALSDVRETVSGYRSLSLAQELDGAREALAAGGVTCTVTPADRALPARVEAILASGVREGVTNVLRHARATSCDIVLAASADAATLEVVDNGVGAEAATDLVAAPGDAPGSGLAGLSERLAAAGGSLISGSGPDGGFRLRAEIPVAA